MTPMKSSRRRLMRWGIAGMAVLMAIAIAVTIASVTGVAWAATNGSAASHWHVGYYTPDPNGALSNASVPSAANGIARLGFTSQPNTALLVTDNRAKFPDLLGNIAGKSVSASFTVSGLHTGAYFTYHGESSGTVEPVSVRYFFETTSIGGFNETNYWWSNPVSANLNTATGTVTLPTVQLTGKYWSDYYGHFGNDPAYAAGFDAAVSHVTMIGLSFGGGSFFENGIATTDGSGSFTLNTYTVK